MRNAQGLLQSERQIHEAYRIDPKIVDQGIQGVDCSMCDSRVDANYCLADMIGHELMQRVHVSSFAVNARPREFGARTTRSGTLRISRTAPPPAAPEVLPA